MPAHEAGKVGAIDESHGDELDAVPIAHVVDAQNVLVGDFAGQQQLLLEALHGLEIVGQAGAHQFERHQAVEFVVVSLIDRSHAALAQQPFNAVSDAENRSRRKSALRRSGFEIDRS